MDKFKSKYRIQSTRLQYWDYGSNSMYFVTICTQGKENYFGNIENGIMILSEIGKIVQECWQNIPAHFPFVQLDESVVMPNHIHGIVLINKPPQLNSPTTNPPQSQNKFGSQSQNLASIIRGFKTGVTKYARKNHINFDWQSRYHDHIIRDNNSLERIRNYIINNPIKWEFDKFNND